MRKKYKVEFIRYWNNSFGGNETIIASYLSSEIEDVKIDPLKFMADNFFIRESREASFTLLNDNFIINELMTGIYSEKINVIFYYDKNGYIISLDGNNPPDEDKYESKDIILQDLFKIFIKIYETDGNSDVYNNLLFTGVVDTDIQPSKDKVSIKAKDTTWFISQTFDKFNLSAYLYQQFGMRIAPFLTLPKDMLSYYIKSIMSNYLEIENIIEVENYSQSIYIMSHVSNTASGFNSIETLPTPINTEYIQYEMLYDNYDTNFNFNNIEMFNLASAYPEMDISSQKTKFLYDIFFTHDNINGLVSSGTSAINSTSIVNNMIIGNTILPNRGTSVGYLSATHGYPENADINCRYLLEFSTKITKANLFSDTIYFVNLTCRLIKNINGITITKTNEGHISGYNDINIYSMDSNNEVELNKYLRTIELYSFSISTHFIKDINDLEITNGALITLIKESNFLEELFSEINILKNYLPTNYRYMDNSFITEEEYDVYVGTETESKQITIMMNNSKIKHVYNDSMSFYSHTYNNFYVYKLIQTFSYSVFDNLKINSSASFSNVIKTFLFHDVTSLYSETNGILKMIELNLDELPNSRFSNNAVVEDIKLSKNKSDFNSAIDAMDYYWIVPQNDDMSDEDYQSTILDVYTNDVLNPIKVRYNQLFNSNYKFILEVEVFKDRIEYQTGVENLSIVDTVEFDLNIGVYRDIRIIGYLIVSKIEETQYTYKLSGIAKKYD